MPRVNPGEPSPRNGSLGERVARLEVRADRQGDEATRTRDRLHIIEGELAAVRYLGERISDMTTALGDLARDVRQLSQRAMERPTAAGWSAMAGWGSLLVAGTALAYALLH